MMFFGSSSSAFVSARLGIPVPADRTVVVGQRNVGDGIGLADDDGLLEGRLGLLRLTAAQLETSERHQ